MLSPKERQGLQDILHRMPVRDVYSLAETISGRMIPMESLEDAIQIVCTCSQRPVNVLTRKKVKKEFLFQYLVDMGQMLEPRADKTALVRAVLKYWNSDDSNACMEMEMSIDEDDHTSAALKVTNSVQEMGTQFAEWFYSLLNSFPQTVVLHGASSVFGTTHFWSDCQLKLVCRDGCGNSKEAKYHSDSDVVKCLGALVAHEKLHLAPNLTTDGVRAVSDPHGLVKILVCGVLHHQNNCIGMFEQLFGLVLDATATNNWKVKFTDLSLQYNSNCVEFET